MLKLEYLEQPGRWTCFLFIPDIFDASNWQCVFGFINVFWISPYTIHSLGDLKINNPKASVVIQIARQNMFNRVPDMHLAVIKTPMAAASQPCPCIDLFVFEGS